MLNNNNKTPAVMGQQQKWWTFFRKDQQKQNSSQKCTEPSDWPLAVNFLYITPTEAVSKEKPSLQEKSAGRPVQVPSAEWPQPQKRSEYWVSSKDHLLTGSWLFINIYLHQYVHECMPACTSERERGMETVIERKFRTWNERENGIDA